MEPVLYPMGMLLVRKHAQVLKVVWRRWSIGTLTLWRNALGYFSFSAIRSLAEGCFGGIVFISVMAAELIVDLVLRTEYKYF